MICDIVTAELGLPPSEIMVAGVRLERTAFEHSFKPSVGPRTEPFIAATFNSAIHGSIRPRRRLMRGSTNRDRMPARESARTEI